jgi:ribose 5-phosphate isomerase B
MKIYLGADHRGFELKAKIAAYLAKRNYPVEDVGNEIYEPADDFPEFAAKACLKIIGSDDSDPRAILICGGGQGMAMAANRFEGIRAVVIFTTDDAKLSRHDNNANVLSLSANQFADGNDTWKKIIDTWLKTPFADKARFVRRNQQMDDLA